MVLDKKVTLYDRDEKGNLIPKEVQLEVSILDPDAEKEFVGQTVRVVPMTRGAIKTTFGENVKMDEDLDAELVEKYCVDPKYTKEELQFIKPSVVRVIAATILRESGLVVPKRNKTTRVDDSDEFGKN